VPEQSPNGTELADPDQDDDTMDPQRYLRDGDGMLPPALTGISAAWIGGLVAVCTGTALSVVGLTLPWAMIRASKQARAYPVYLTEFNSVLAPGAAALLVLAAMCAGVCFASRSRAGAMLRSVTVVTSMLWISMVLAATTYLARGLTMTIVDPLGGTAVEILVQSTTLSTGSIVYFFGTMLLVLGTVASVRLPSPLAQHPQTSQFATGIFALRAGLRWVVTLLALGLAVTSIALPWYKQIPASGRSEGAPVVVSVQDLHLWQGTYRIGLIACILLYAAALVAAQGAASRAAGVLRALGMMASTVVVAILLVGLMALWHGDAVGNRRPNYLNPAPHAAAGYFVAVAAMIALLCGIALISSVVPRKSAASDEVAAPGADGNHE
jgi:hypothetical protein